MATRSVVTEARQIELAVELIELGARLQVLVAETSLSRERLLKLYKEVRGESPPKGMLPFSADWFLAWQPNVHASLFAEIHRFLTREAGVEGIAAAIKAYRLYLEHIGIRGLEPVLSFTRIWTMLRFVEAGLLQMAPCTRCHGRFVVHALDLSGGFVCGLCAPPSRAGKSAPRPLFASSPPEASASPSR